MTSTGKDFYRPDEVAKKYNVSRSTVYFWIDTGKLEAVKIAGFTLRIPKDELQKIEKPKID
jgi:excisionase family DNA binding protein